MKRSTRCDGGPDVTNILLSPHEQIGHGVDNNAGIQQRRVQRGLHHFVSDRYARGNLSGNFFKEAFQEAHLLSPVSS